MPLTTLQFKKILIEHAIINEKQFDEIQRKAERRHESIENILVEEGLVKDEYLGRILADALNFPFVNLRKEKISEEILNIVPELVARKQKIISFRRDTKGVALAMHDPENLEMIWLIQKKTGEKVIPYFATELDIKETIAQYKQAIRGELRDLVEETMVRMKEGKFEELAEEAPVIRFVASLLEYAYQNRASDIHLEPHEKDVVARYRIDGILHDVIHFSKEVYELVLMRIKILSRLRTDEHKAAQDGRFSHKINDEKVDIRVSVVPITEGEKTVMRLLSSRSQRFNLNELGLNKQDLKKVRASYKKSYGMILATGPTGCGKTTTLYSILHELNKREVNISTIEDPVEYEMEGVNQIQVDAKSGLTFAKGLRTIVRQDPDIIMIGEIRDEESTKIAINMAMTGHLVLSTIHTINAATTLPRLLDLGAEAFLIASSINIIIAQRLVRKICLRCIESYILEPKELKILKEVVDLDKIMGRKVKELRLYRGKGCSACNNTGFSGRVGIFEVLEITEEIRSLIMKKASADEIQEMAKSLGMTTMTEDGIQKVLTGITTFEELIRVIHE